jgi:ABC-type transport system involved in multi-copper enzyme maturation permease subunit
VDSSIDMFGYTIYSYFPTPSLAAVVMLVYALVSIGLSMFMFRRKQLTG